MLSADIQTEIGKLEVQIQNLLTELDNKVNTFVSELPPTVKVWMESEVERRVAQSADRILQMGPDGVRVFKDQIFQLYEKLPEICTRAASNQNAWPHRPGASSNRPSPQTNNDSYFDSVFRRAISHLGPLLREHSLVKTNLGQSSSNWERINEGTVNYVGLDLGYKVSGLPVLQEYEQIRMKLIQLQSNLSNRRNELQTAKAKELWGSV